MKIMALLYEKESYDIRGVCFEIYKKFYCNQKEKVYQNAIADDLQLKGYQVEREKRVIFIIIKNQLALMWLI